MSQGTKGYIKLYRDLQDCWVWFDDDKFTKGQAWVDLLMLANHKDKKMSFKEEIIVIKRGQYVTSIAKLSARWGWSFNTTKRFLNLLESDNMLTRRSDNRKTLITIVNYGIYQGDDDSKTTNADRQTDSQVDRQTDSQADSPDASKLIVKLTPNNKEKNVNKEKNNIYCVSFEEFWSIYPRKVDKKKTYRVYMTRLKEGFSEDEIIRAAKNYAEECEKDDRDKKYIKHPSTFLGPDTPFTEYIKDKDNGKNNSTKQTEYTEEQLRAFMSLV